MMKLIMKICVISTPVFSLPVSGYSGLEHLAWLTAKGLAEKGHSVGLVAPEGSSCPGVSIISNGVAGSWDERQGYQKYWQELLKFECIIDESWNKWSLVLKQEGPLKVPVLSVCHAPIDTMYKKLPPVDKPCFVCISQDQADHFQALFGREAKVAHNGVDAENFYKPLSIKRSDRFLFLARFSTIKGPDLAIQAAKEANVGLDMIGDTSITNEPEFFESCKRATDGEQIKIIGSATRGECVWWFSQARALLHLNQRFREPFGLSPVEALGCQCPVIAWNYGAMRETIKHGTTGFLVNSVGDVVDLIKSKAIDKIDGATCREWAKQFSVERMVNRYEELCIEAIRTGGW